MWAFFCRGSHRRFPRRAQRTSHRYHLHFVAPRSSSSIFARPSVQQARNVPFVFGRISIVFSYVHTKVQWWSAARFHVATLQVEPVEMASFRDATSCRTTHQLCLLKPRAVAAAEITVHFPDTNSTRLQIESCLRAETPSECTGATECQQPVRSSGMFDVQGMPLVLHVGMDVPNDLNCMIQADGVLMGCSTFGQIAGMLNKGLSFFSVGCHGPFNGPHYKMVPPMVRSGCAVVPISPPKAQKACPHRAFTGGSLPPVGRGLSQRRTRPGLHTHTLTISKLLQRGHNLTRFERWDPVGAFLTLSRSLQRG